MPFGTLERCFLEEELRLFAGYALQRDGLSNRLCRLACFAETSSCPITPLLTRCLGRMKQGNREQTRGFCVFRAWRKLKPGQYDFASFAHNGLKWLNSFSARGWMAQDGARAQR